VGATETDELFSYDYFGNPEVHAIKHPEKNKIPASDRI
jgi:hypothetical protein